MNIFCKLEKFVSIKFSLRASRSWMISLQMKPSREKYLIIFWSWMISLQMKPCQRKPSKISRAWMISLQVEPFRQIYPKSISTLSKFIPHSNIKGIL